MDFKGSIDCEKLGQFSKSCPLGPRGQMVPKAISESVFITFSGLRLYLLEDLRDKGREGHPLHVGIILIIVVFISRYNDTLYCKQEIREEKDVKGEPEPNAASKKRKGPIRSCNACNVRLFA